MAKHLNRDRWMRRTTTGSWMLKRVSADNEAQFPRRYREILRDHGAARLVKIVMDDFGLDLAESWSKVKDMVNGPRRSS
jgi:hypothetical protein